MKKKKKNKLLIFILLSVVSGLLIIFGASTFIFYSYFNKLEKVSINKNDLSISTEVTAKYETSKEIKNIALFGIDSEDGLTGRSDAIMIATLDEAHSKLKLTSIMRDSYVNIPDRGMDKINHAYAFGGPQLSIKTINENFGLNIDSFMAVNFTSLPEIIDLLGGVEINVIEEEVPHIPGLTSAGSCNLDGVQALAYSRIRYASGGDYKRTERQRTVLNALFTKFLSTSTTNYPDLLSSILPYVQTNLSPTDILSLGTKALSCKDNGLQQERFPLDGYCDGIMLNDVYYLSFDAAQTKKQFMDYIFNDIR